MVENLQAGSPTKFADLKFGDSLISEICGIAIADWALKTCRFEKSYARLATFSNFLPESTYLWQIFEQIWNGPNVIFRGLGGNWFMKKTWSQKSCGTAPLNFLLHVQHCTKWKHQILAVIPCQLETISHSHDCESTTRSPPPTQTHTQVTSVYFKSVGEDFTHNTTEMFSFGPNPTRAKKAWSSSTCLLYVLPSNLLSGYRSI